MAAATLGDGDGREDAGETAVIQIYMNRIRRVWGEFCATRERSLRRDSGSLWYTGRILESITAEAEDSVSATDPQRSAMYRVKWNRTA